MLLKLLGAVLVFPGNVAVPKHAHAGRADSMRRAHAGDGIDPDSLTPLRLPHPLPVYTQRESYLATGPGTGLRVAPAADPFLSEFTVFDDVIVAPELDRYVVCAWGDRVFPEADDYVGYNHDYTGFVPLEADHADGILWINHEYISFPFSRLAPRIPAELVSMRAAESFATVVGFDLAPALGRETLGEMLYNLGGSAVRIRKNDRGRYGVVAGDRRNRRIHGLSGLAINATRRDRYSSITSWGERAHQHGDDRYLVGTGPAAAEVFAAVDSDGLGNKIIGTAFNCSGATTPWGTILSAEENFQAEISRGFFLGVTEAVGPDGAQVGYAEGSAGREFGLVGEKYGWIVEIDPLRPRRRARKHTALGRVRHENIALRCERGRPLIAYCADDRRGGHVYKYISKRRVDRVESPRNSRLLAEGTLYAARFHPDGTGRWLALTLETPTSPNAPDELCAGECAQRQDGAVADEPIVALPARAGVAGAAYDGGAFIVTRANEAGVLPAYRGRRLGDFYRTQGALLCDAFHAANLAGATPGARPEEIEIHPITGEVFVAFSSADPGGDGYPDSRIFMVGKYSDAVAAAQPHGALFKITETSAAADGETFRWERVLVGGEVGAEGGRGFANLDNLVFDGDARLWCVTDMPNEVLNGAWTDDVHGPTKLRHDAALSGKEARALAGVFGNNWIFAVGEQGVDAGTIVPIAYGPVACELTGPTWLGDTLLISVQHPGEDAPINDGSEPCIVSRNVAMLDLDGELRVQRRTAPRGSNWPSQVLGDPFGPPRPAVVAIVRKDQTFVRARRS